MNNVFENKQFNGNEIITYIYILGQEKEILLTIYGFMIKPYFTYLFLKKPLNRNLFQKQITVEIT